jgi:hypothetical protein
MKMNPWLKIALPTVALVSLIPLLAEVSAPKAAGSAANAATAIGEMTKAAQDFLADLDEPQKAQATFTMDGPEREDWHFVPFERKGLTLKEMRPDQQHLAYGLLHTALSYDGFRKATQIMSLEKILWDLENQAPKRDAAKYYVSIFGTPSATGTWGWRFEGHHLSMNFTIVDGKNVAITPSFMGANPGEVLAGNRAGLQVLQREETLGFELINALDDEQKKTAIILEKSPEEVITKDDHHVKPLEPLGLNAGKMTPAQQAKVQEILEIYLRRYRAEIADSELSKIAAAGWDKLNFAWAGATQTGAGHYYRVQGATFLIEFDNTQNNAHHPHAVLRDFGNDFGTDYLKQHLQTEHAK